MDAPIMPKVPPSPDYKPGPEDHHHQTTCLALREPERHHLHIYIPLIPSCLPPDSYRLTMSRDPEEDPEEDDEENPEEDPADYPADRGDRDDEESSDDDDDAEEEHLAPADPAAVAYSADQDPIPCLTSRRQGCPSDPGAGTIPLLKDC
ncbi:hypothetical protein Tco_0740227 [Tanacetum coccineum]|uniref:Uncharacterized protein n=1 Tax=Tanacetum coccineum TaxID=301880 RepID=A0ABQ4ZE75_9ASTR